MSSETSETLLVSTQTHSSITMDQLPAEVLSRIFEWLPCSDRNVVRVVCRKWYHECRTKHVQMAEKFTITNLCQTAQQKRLLHWLEACDRRYLNLEFREVQLREYPTSFWQNCGPLIHSLSLSKCGLPHDTFVTIVKSCGNLKTLTLLSTLSSISWDVLVSSRITNPSVQSLKVDELSAEPLYHLLSVFPNVTKLSSHNKTNKWSAAQEACACLLCAPMSFVVISPAGQMRAANRPNHKQNSIEAISNSARFREVVFDIGQANFGTVLEFLNSQPTLEVLHCRVKPFNCSEYNQYSTSLLMKAINGCPNLHTFRLDSRNGIFWTVELFDKLAASRIRTLDFDCLYHAFDELELFQVNQTVSRLSLKYKKPTSGQIHVSWCSSTKLLLKAFSHLKHLCLFWINQEILRMVNECQTNLTVLRIPMINRTDEPFQIEANPLNRLHMLEELIVGSELRYLQLTPELVLPNLRCMCIGTKEPFEYVLDSLGKMPLLEILVLKITDKAPSLNIDNIAALCSKLKRLKYLRIFGENDPDTKFPRDKIEMIFHSCRSLRILTCGNSTCGSVFYFKCIGLTDSEIYTKRFTCLLNPAEIFDPIDNFENYVTLLKKAVVPGNYTELMNRRGGKEPWIDLSNVNDFMYSERNGGVHVYRSVPNRMVRLMIPHIVLNPLHVAPVIHHLNANVDDIDDDTDDDADDDIVFWED